MINKIGKITIYVNDQAAAKKFWCEQMDFVVALEQPMGPHMTWLEVAPSKDAQTSFILYNKEMMRMQNNEANVEHPNVLLSTTDIATAYEKMQTRGVEVGLLQEMPYGKMFAFKDQDGNNYLLREDK